MIVQKHLKLFYLFFLFFFAKIKNVDLYLVTYELSFILYIYLDTFELHCLYLNKKIATLQTGTEEFYKNAYYLFDTI